MNILVVVGYNPFVVKDGNATLVSSLVRELVYQGHKVILLVYTIPFKKYMRIVPFHGITQYLFPVRVELLLLGFILRKFFRVPAFYLICSLTPPFRGFGKVVQDIVKKHKIDIIQCENIYTVFPASEYVGAVPVVVTAPDVLYDRYKQTLRHMNVFRPVRETFLKWVQRMELDGLKRASVCVCVSEEDRNRFIEMGIDGEKLIVISNGVDCDSIAPMAKDLGLLKQLRLSCDDPVLFFGGSGQLQNKKAVDDITNVILPQVIKDFPNLKIIFTGNVCEYITERKLDKLYPENIIKAGYVENLANYYSLVDIVILPITLGSGTKLKAAEAFAAGKPVISTDMGIAGYDVVDGEDVIVENCMDKFPAQIKGLLGNPVLRKKLCENARKKSLKYDWGFLMKNYNDLYQNLSIHSNHVETAKKLSA